MIYLFELEGGVVDSFSELEFRRLVDSDFLKMFVILLLMDDFEFL